MKKGIVKVQGDHLKKITAARTPLEAVAEFIWNGLDADAEELTVEFDEGNLTKLGAIRIVDYGDGIPVAEAVKLFESLGGSWKASQEKTPKGRFIHGKQGQGRFKAFYLGNSVQWDTTCRQGRKVVSYTISATLADLTTFTVSDPKPSDRRLGTTCTISDIHKDFRIRGTDEVLEEITEIFAPHLYEHRQLKLIYDGSAIDPAAAISNHKVLPISCVSSGGENLKGTLTAIEWSTKTNRSLYLCTSKNFPIVKVAPGVRPRGFNFTAYLSAAHFDSFTSENSESLIELNADSSKLIDAAKDQLREHFRQREAQLAKSRVDQWIDQKIYPFQGEPPDPIARSERDIFDVLAVNLADYSKAFEDSAPEAKKVTFGLLKAALESGPAVVRKIFQEVLQLPPELQEDLSELLEKTTLPAIIEASREIVDRLDFLAGLSILIFNPKS